MPPLACFFCHPIIFIIIFAAQEIHFNSKSMKHPHRAQHLPWEDCAELPLQSETANALAWVNDMTKKITFITNYTN